MCAVGQTLHIQTFALFVSIFLKWQQKKRSFIMVKCVQKRNNFDGTMLLLWKKNEWRVFPFFIERDSTLQSGQKSFGLDQYKDVFFGDKALAER